jgi:peptidoglycan/LPS O-acetylase OafA/YrhL
MQGLRSIAAIVAGFGFMASTVMVGTIIATALFIPAAGGSAPAPLPVMYLVASLVMSFLGAVLGGWLAARIGSSAPFAHAAVLAALTAVLSVVSAIQGPPGAQPGWHPIVAGIVSVAGVLLGGRLRALAASADGAVVA